jgi:Protein of unknown function (DUF416)
VIRVPLAEYDRALKGQLSALSSATRAAFAAACAERLYPAYAAYQATSGFDDEGRVRRALDLAWDTARRDRTQEDDLSATAEQLRDFIAKTEAERVIPDDIDDAIASAVYALDAAAGTDPSAAGWAATRVTDAIDSFVLANDIEDGRSEVEQRVWDHPLVKAEIGRRADDLRRLSGASDWAAAVDAVRASAAAVSALPLDRLHREA